jgi:error-prone DNA polymerase
MRYAELQVTSNFSFLRGASAPPELVARAHELGLAAIAITDRNTLAGVVRAHEAAKEAEMRLVIGARLDFTDAPSLLAFPTDRAAYGRLSQMLTDGKMRATKGECELTRDDLFKYGDGMRLIALCDEAPDADFAAHLKSLHRRFGRSLYLAAHHLYRGDDAKRLARLGGLADSEGIPLIATNDVHAHIAERRPLQDVLTCIREGCTIAEAGFRLHANAERHLKSPDEMARLFRRRPDAVARTLEIVEACSFSLDALRYEYPVEPVPEGRTPQEELVRLTWHHAAERYPQGIPEKVEKLLRKELAFIEQEDYARYFLTVYDIVRFAKEKKILCQGRGSAANSAVCYVLGITAVDPEKVALLFERFVSSERKEPPDIDVDFEHERREEVIQYIYKKYGRDRAGIVATLVTYRPKSAIRDVGKALGLSTDTVGILSGTLWGWGREGIQEQYIREAGLDPSDFNLRRALKLAAELIGFPRHLSQHTGGFVITRGKLSEVVPIEKAAMKDRSVIEWDKDDLDTLRMLKIDVLALGMLTCLRKGFELVRDHYGVEPQLYGLPEEKEVYDMLCRADSVGVFQVESRAQMTMLPRLKPRDFYDLVIEVAIVRPGPIQGDMVHPYLRRRNKKEPVTFPKEELREVLFRTCGVPLFQEQAMQIAMVAARFTSEEANKLRRAMATFRHTGTIHTLKERFIVGMIDNGYERDFAERCFAQIEGFGEYGFPESHAASFALLVYASAWLKCRYPAVFACAILNSQPMGFYQPAQLVRDARDHGVEVRPPDVAHSHWDCTLEPDGKGGLALRLGFRQIKGFREKDAERLVAAREAGDSATMRVLWLGAALEPRALETLAKGDSWKSQGLDRRGALWEAKGLGEAPLPLFAFSESSFPRKRESTLPQLGCSTRDSRLRGNDDERMHGVEDNEPSVVLPPLSLPEEVGEDYQHLSLSLKAHPVSLFRDRFDRRGILPSRNLRDVPDGTWVKVAGLVLVRQQPGTASGVIFMTLEDETGVANIVVWQTVFQQFRRILLGSRLLGVAGRVQRDESGYVIHVVADEMVDLSAYLNRLSEPPEAYDAALSRADVVKHPGFDRRGEPSRRRIPASRDFR